MKDTASCSDLAILQQNLGNGHVVDQHFGTMPATCDFAVRLVRLIKTFEAVLHSDLAVLAASFVEQRFSRLAGARSFRGSTSDGDACDNVAPELQ